jgi:hypothetical protein
VIREIACFGRLGAISLLVLAECTKERTAEGLGNHFEGSSYLRLLFPYSFGPAAAWARGLAPTFLRRFRIEFTA